MKILSTSPATPGWRVVRLRDDGLFEEVPIAFWVVFEENGEVLSTPFIGDLGVGVDSLTPLHGSAFLEEPLDAVIAGPGQRVEYDKEANKLRVENVERPWRSE